MSISDNVTLIPQEPEIFTTTMRRNITLGIPYKKTVINRFVKMAKFATVAKRLPQGLETDVMEKGVSLSGGEKQRLALARGLISVGNSELILLDEPTSSVDSKNSGAIYKGIFDYFKGRTIIVSVHNLNQLRDFDHIYYFSDGKIVESGNFEKLMKESKRFKRLWDKFQKKK